jgi:hypothetical protein
MLAQPKDLMGGVVLCEGRRVPEVVEGLAVLVQAWDAKGVPGSPRVAQVARQSSADVLG